MNKRSRTTKNNQSRFVKSSKCKGDSKGEEKCDDGDLMCPYEVNERILCYEPDPLKCKVLYEAKILKITSSFDACGNTEFQYMVHFQGWNSSWDRFVAEDLIMKDTAESRQLQAELNYLAATHLKKGKHKSTKAVGVPLAKRQKLHTTKRVIPHRNREPQFIQLEEVEGSEGGDDEEEDFNLQITLLEPFTKLLELDYFRIHVDNQLPVLPAPTSISEILERFVKYSSFQKLERWYKKFQWGLLANRTAGNPAGKSLPTVHVPPLVGQAHSSSSSSDLKTPDELLKILNEGEVMKQLATDMTLMFDCYVQSILLYNSEQGRYEACFQDHITSSAFSKIDVPEGLQFPENEEKIAITTEQSTSKKVQLPVGMLTSVPDPKDVTGDSEDILVELHCRQRISSFARELVTWSLASDYGREKYARPSLIYGLPHLLRLLVKIPDVLVKSDLKKSRLHQVSIFVNRLLSFILAEFQEDHMVYEKINENP